MSLFLSRKPRLCLNAAIDRNLHAFWCHPRWLIIGLMSRKIWCGLFLNSCTKPNLISPLELQTPVTGPHQNRRRKDSSEIAGFLSNSTRKPERIKIIRTMKPLRSLQKCLFLFVSTNAFYENISLSFKPIPLQLSNKLRKREKAKKVSFKA